MSRPLALLALLGFTLAVPAADLTTLKGPKHTGEVVSIDERAVVIKAGDDEVVTPLPEILQLALREQPDAPLPEKYIDVELVDGTQFHCINVTFRGKQVELELPSKMKLTVVMQAVSSILRDAQDEGLRRQWTNITSERTRSDRFFIRKEGRLDGLEGTFGDADAQGRTIAFTDAAGTKRNLPLDRLAALLFNNRLEGVIPDTVCRVIDAHRNTIVAQKAVLKDKTLSILTVGGITIDYPTLDSIAMLDYSKDKIVYLSDLKPIAEDKQFDELPVIVSKDVNLDNQPIQLEGVPYSKGMVLHAPLSLTYDIAAQYKEFKAIIGVDTSVQTPSHVRLVFEGDGRKLFETEVKVKDAPKPVTLDVKKVRQFTIRVVQVEGLPYGHQVTLADAKVTK